MIMKCSSSFGAKLYDLILHDDAKINTKGVFSDGQESF
jgi:hypothetical protein